MININIDQLTDEVADLIRQNRVTHVEGGAVGLYEHTLDRLRKGVAIFVFTKKDGSYRKAIGTLNEATIPTERGPEAKRYITPSADKQTFYDLQINQFRSFSVDSVVALIDF